MPRSTTRGKRGAIWLPEERTLTHDIKIDGDSVKTNVLSSEFTKGVCPEVGSFKVNLINADEVYSDKYKQGDTVQMFADYGAGTTERFEGKIDKIMNRYDQRLGFVLELSGGHLTRELMDITVTETYNASKTISEILDDLNTTYLTDYTINYTATDTSKPIINWDNKYFWDCIYDLVKLADADAVLTDSKQLNFFDRSSIANDDEPIVWSQNMINTKGLGTQTITTKNKITVLGDDGTGLPVIYTSNDLTSQTAYGTKELPVFDSKITNQTQAQEVADAEKTRLATPEDEGEAESFFLPTLSPGEKIWITSPPLKINGQYRVYKFTHRLPMERTTSIVGKERKIPQLFKKRIENELASQTVTNPFKMTKSINMKFDDNSEILSKDSNVRISGGILSLASGSQGVITSINHSYDTDVTEAHLRVVGSTIVGTDFEISTDKGTSYDDLVLDNPVSITPGADVIIRITIQSAATEIDSIFVGLK